MDKKEASGMNHHYANILRTMARLNHQGAYNSTKGDNVRAEAREIKTQRAKDFTLHAMMNRLPETNWFINKKLGNWKYEAVR